MPTESKDYFVQTPKPAVESPIYISMKPATKVVLTGRGWMPASAMVKDENRGLEVYDRVHPAA